MKNASGKLVIIAIIVVALVAAGIGWWFRYNATHRAVLFWGPRAAELIRDAPEVELYEYGRLPNDDYQKLVNGRNISRAPGLIHLRNALLEDRSFNWPPESMRPGSWGWAIFFRDPKRGDEVKLNFAHEWDCVDSPDHETILSCKPISAGLAKFVSDVPALAIEPAR